MKLYDIKCPICGTVNRKLVLEETDGWMECEHCRIVVKVLPYDGDKAGNKPGWNLKGA